MANLRESEEVVKPSPTQPLREVVTECVRRWFRITLKAAVEGEVEMQILVAQMYFSGYGVPCNPAMAKYWMKKAAGQHRQGSKIPGGLPGDAELPGSS